MWNRHRQDNANRVLEWLWRNGDSSRAALARSLRLDRSTVGTIVDQLLERGLLHTSNGIAPDSSRRGRPPVRIKLDRTIGCSIGIELSGSKIICVATDLAGMIISSGDWSGSRDQLTDCPFLVSRVHALVSQLRAGLPGVPVLGVCLAVPGMVDTTTGTILRSRALGVVNPWTIGEEVSSALGLPVSIYNDADACAVGELEYRGGSDLLYVLVRYQPHPQRVNVGLGIILDGHLREAHSGTGREFRSPFAPPETPDQFGFTAQLREEPDLPTKQWLDAFSEELGVSVAFLVHALDLRNVVFGGDILLPPLDEADLEGRLRHHVMSSTAHRDTQTLDVGCPARPVNNVAWSAAAAALRRRFADRTFPIETETETSLTSQAVV